jgi:hypothetical protein
MSGVRCARHKEIALGGAKYSFRDITVFYMRAGKMVYSPIKSLALIATSECFFSAPSREMRLSVLVEIYFNPAN